MAETAVIAALSKFGELAAREADVLLRVGDEMLLLRDRLEWLQAFIRDADQKRRAGTDGLTRVWVRQIRDVAFRAEDALDQFFYQVELRNLHERFNIWRKPNSCYNIIIRHGLSYEIKSIKSRLNQISENQKAYNIQHTPLVTSTSSTTTSLAWQDDYFGSPVGLNDDMKTLNDMVHDETNHMQVFIFILGESGAGKFTLGDTAYFRLRKKFEVYARYNMPPDSNTEVLLKGVYKQAHLCLKLNNPGFEEPVDLPNDDAAEKLRRLLTPRNVQATNASTKKYLLLVVGGISSMTFLNCLKACLPDDKTVVLILDTESEEVTRHADTMDNGRTNKTLMLSRLDEARSEQLFCSRAFVREKNTKGNAEPSMRNEMEEKSQYNKTVYIITGGYPLAIVLLAGLLRFKEKHRQWEAVLQQLNPSTELSEENPAASARTEANLSTRTVIDRVFWASFDDLPNDIKSCFLYFAAFARHTFISAQEMVRMWVAEGFVVKPELGKTMEEQGEDYLKELVSRCLVQIVETNASRGIDKVRIHMRLHGFLRSEVREAGFIELHDMQDAFVPQSVRRIAFKSFDSRYTMHTNKFPKLRSFICNVAEGDGSSGNTAEGSGGRSISRWRCTGAKKKDDMDDIKFLNASKFLRVVSIVGLKLEKLPKEMGVSAPDEQDTEGHTFSPEGKKEQAGASSSRENEPLGPNRPVRAKKPNDKYFGPAWST
ncbi:unnamed protein product [Alopecurus aequalis]